MFLKWKKIKIIYFCESRIRRSTNRCHASFGHQWKPIRSTPGTLFNNCELSQLFVYNFSCLFTISVVCLQFQLFAYNFTWLVTISADCLQFHLIVYHFSWLFIFPAVCLHLLFTFFRVTIMVDPTLTMIQKCQIHPKTITK